MPKQIYRWENNTSRPDREKEYTKYCVFFVWNDNYCRINLSGDELAELGGFTKKGEDIYEKDGMTFYKDGNSLRTENVNVVNTLKYVVGGKTFYFSDISEIFEHVETKKSIGVLNGELFHTLEAPFKSTYYGRRENETKTFETFEEAYSHECTVWGATTQTINGARVPGVGSTNINHGRLPLRNSGSITNLANEDDKY